MAPGPSRNTARRQGRSITAAGVRLDRYDQNGQGGAVPKRTGETWKSEAWAYFDAVPEVKFAARFLGNAVARLRFYPAYIAEQDDAPVPLVEATQPRPATPDDDGTPYVTTDVQQIADDEFARLNHGPDGMAGIQREYAINTTIVGDCNLIGRDVNGAEEWCILPEDAVKKGDGDGRYIINDSDTGEPVEIDTTDAGGDFAARIWRRHSRKPWLSDSNMRAVLDVCEELLIYNRALRGTGKSRNNAGILLLPNELDFEAVEVVETLDDDDDPDTPDVVINPDEAVDDLTDFERGIIASIVTPTVDDGSAASVAPHLLRGPADALKEVRHIALARTIDPEVLARIDHLIQRLAHGLDVPVEILTGVAEANHWSAWQIEDSTYKAHVEPLASILAQALATTFLRPQMLARGVDPEIVDRIVVAIDPSALVVRPNRGQDALSAFDALAISWAALRQHLGFPESDAPDVDELALRYPIIHSGRPMGGPGAAPAPPDGSSGGEPIPQTEDVVPPADGSTPSPAKGPEPVLAAGTPRSDLGQRLAQIDSRLRERLQAAASAALTAALARGGGRLRAAVQGDPELAKRTKGVDNAEVGQAIGEGHANTAELVTAADFADLHRQWDGWVAQARAQAIVAVRAEGDRRDLDPDTIESAVSEMQTSFEGDRDAGWSALQASLVDMGRRRLFAPDGTPDQGEFDANMAVPVGAIRVALAIMGDGGLADETPGLGGPATGASMMRLGVGFALGAATIAYQWTSGTSDRPFEPHSALDGALLTGPDDPTLLYDEWPADGGFLYPGDHLGCGCSMDPVVAFGFDEGDTGGGGDAGDGGDISAE